mgnify:CR=1 FL=1
MAKKKRRRRNARSLRGMATTESLLTIGVLVGIPVLLATTLALAARQRSMKTASN